VALTLFRIKSEDLELAAPFGRQIAETLDADTAGQAAFYGGLDKIGREEGERDGQIDLPHAAFLASTKLSDSGRSTRDNIVKPPTTSCDGTDKSRAPFKPFWADLASRLIVRKQDLTGSSGRRFLPGNRELDHPGCRIVRRHRLI
jgi:hypothetical protein